jgi:hypothetical protein
MDAETSAALRAEFPEKTIGKLPRLVCKACIDGKGQCSEHRKAKCPECGAYTSPAHIHLDYVGHAAVTDRLLAVDPEWTWEPVAIGPDGLPAFDARGGLWIRLTVAGVERLGYGDSGGKNTPDGVKEAIGDGLRNAAMRFGVALDLWSKEALSAGELTNPSPSAAPGSGSSFHRGNVPDLGTTPGEALDQETLAYGEGVSSSEGGASPGSSSGSAEEDTPEPDASSPAEAATSDPVGHLLSEGGGAETGGKVAGSGVTPAVQQTPPVVGDTPRMALWNELVRITGSEAKARNQVNAWFRTSYTAKTQHEITEGEITDVLTELEGANA